MGLKYKNKNKNKGEQLQLKSDQNGIEIILFCPGVYYHRLLLKSDQNGIEIDYPPTP